MLAVQYPGPHPYPQQPSERTRTLLHCDDTVEFSGKGEGHWGLSGRCSRGGAGVGVEWEVLTAVLSKSWKASIFFLLAQTAGSYSDR